MVPSVVVRARGNVRQDIIRAGHDLMARNGYTAVGIAEILAQAQVPKGSFYHYFASKDAFGDAVMNDYFATYLADMDGIFAGPGTALDRLMGYWQYWYGLETGDHYAVKCLAVKLGAEVADLSEHMRSSLERGTSAAIDRIAGQLAAGAADGSVAVRIDGSLPLARMLYDLWMGASIRAKIDRDTAPLDEAMDETRRMLSPG